MIERTVRQNRSRTQVKTKDNIPPSGFARITLGGGGQSSRQVPFQCPALLSHKAGDSSRQDCSPSYRTTARSGRYYLPRLLRAIILLGSFTTAPSPPPRQAAAVNPLDCHPHNSRPRLRFFIPISCFPLRRAVMLLRGAVISRSRPQDAVLQLPLYCGITEAAYCYHIS